MDASTATEPVKGGTFAAPARDCDLVMKGGLTSGIVYPAAVLKLAKDFRFHSVGGTSAGAIAAAVTAAAEAGRGEGGFEKLESVAEEIAEPGFLVKIFRAGGAARSLMNLFVSLLARRPKKRGVAGKVWFFGPALYVRLVYFMPVAFLCGAVLGALVCGGAAYLVAMAGHELDEWWANLTRSPLASTPTLWGGVAIVAWLGFVVGGAAGALARIVWLLVVYLPKYSFFGICTGYAEGDADILTNWLHAKINELAGREASDAAVTFKDLSDKGVDLKVVSTNLAQNRPYIFPREPEGFRLVFSKAEMERLFPPEVVRVLMRNKIVGEYRGPRLPAGYFYLAERDELPVVIATRMSLSFPVLISAIPMYAVKPSAYRGKSDQDNLNVTDLQKHWFSDGGICSNFPIGLFDSWMPRWPTYGINLNYVKEGQKKEGTVPAEHVPGEGEAESGPRKPDVFLPPVGARMWPQWNALEQLPSFLGAIFSTAQNYRDTLQSILPSYSERIAQVWLDPEEGGMNLTMDEGKIKSLADKGAQAGDLLSAMDFDGHRCMRLRVLMKVLCHEIDKLHGGYPDIDRFKSVATAEGTWCGKQADWWPQIEPHIQALVTFADSLTNATPSASDVFKGPPVFEGDLHIHPKI